MTNCRTTSGGNFAGSAFGRGSGVGLGSVRCSRRGAAPHPALRRQTVQRLQALSASAGGSPSGAGLAASACSAAANWSDAFFRLCPCVLFQNRSTKSTGAAGSNFFMYSALAWQWPQNGGNVGRLERGAEGLVLAMVLEFFHRGTAAVAIVAQQALLPVDVSDQVLGLNDGRLLVPQFALFGVTEVAGVVFRHLASAARVPAAGTANSNSSRPEKNVFMLWFPARILWEHVSTCLGRMADGLCALDGHEPYCRRASAVGLAVKRHGATPWRCGTRRLGRRWFRGLRSPPSAAGFAAGSGGGGASASGLGGSAVLGSGSVGSGFSGSGFGRFRFRRLRPRSVRLRRFGLRGFGFLGLRLLGLRLHRFGLGRFGLGTSAACSALRVSRPRLRSAAVTAAAPVWPASAGSGKVISGTSIFSSRHSSVMLSTRPRVKRVGVVDVVDAVADAQEVTSC